MKKEEILTKLCYYDNRNPNNILEECTIKPIPCFCDNCHYGRTEMAKYIIELIDMNDELIDALETIKEYHGKSLLPVIRVCLDDILKRAK